MEVDDRQSNFDEVDRPVHRRVGQRVDQRRRRSAATCRPTRRSDFGPRARLRLRRDAAAAAPSSAAASACSGTSRPAARRRRRRRTSRSCSRGDHDHDFGQTNMPCRTDCRRRRASIPNVPPAGTTRSAFDIDFRDAYARQLEHQRAAAVRHQLHGRDRLRRLARPADAVLKGDPNQAPPVVGVTDSERQPSVRGAVAGAADRRAGCRARARWTTTAC